MKKIKIVCVIGTRPEALKMAPVIEALKQNEFFEIYTVLTAQHRGLLDQMMKNYNITIDADFDLMTPNQSLSEVSAKLIIEFEKYYQKRGPDLVIAQGDTSTTMIAGLAAFYQKIPYAHVEAGLRTSDIQNPFPEELNRRIASRIATLHFCPTTTSEQNLKAEGIVENVYVVGNTIIDTLYQFSSKVKEIKTEKKVILVTCHRRENFGKPMETICESLKQIAKENADVEIIFPVHPNPKVQKTVLCVLDNIENIKLVDPMSYEELVAVLKSCYFVLTDSGGLQEEGPALGKPVLVLRNETERHEGVECGVAKVVGRKKETILPSVNLLLRDSKAYAKMIKGGSPYGDGKSSMRIVKQIETFFEDRIKKTTEDIKKVAELVNNET